MQRTTIEIPTHCPCCASKLEVVNTQLFCRNSSCEAQLYKKLEHFAKVLGIKGLGPKTIDKLGLSDIPELFYLGLEDFSSALGSDKLAEKLLEEVDKARKAPLHLVLASFSIPLIGDTASRKICSVIASVEDITVEKCKEAGLGDKATANLMAWKDTDLAEMREFLPFSFKVEKTNLNRENAGATVCITGKLTSYKTKSEAHEALLNAGYTPVDSVTKTTKYLVDETGGTSSKRQKAEQYGIHIITNLTQFLLES